MSKQLDDQQEEEVFTAERFCALYQESQHRPCKVVRQCDPPMPDFLIDVDGREVFLELAGYREQGPHNIAQDLDWELKELISTAWQEDPTVQHFLVSLHYHEHGQMFRVPNRKADRATFVRELKAVVCRVGYPLSEQVIHVGLVPADRVEWWAHHSRGTQWLANEDYPVLGKYCSSIHIICHPGVCFSMPSSSLNTGMTAVDKKELQKVYTNKIGKLPGYRAEAEGRTVWLLVYSLCWPFSARVAPRLQGMLLEHLQSIVDKQPQFDSVWWGYNLGIDTGTVHPVCQDVPDGRGIVHRESSIRRAHSIGC